MGVDGREIGCWAAQYHAGQTQALAPGFREGSETFAFWLVSHWNPQKTHTHMHIPSWPSSTSHTLGAEVRDGLRVKNKQGSDLGLEPTFFFKLKGVSFTLAFEGASWKCVCLIFHMSLSEQTQKHWTKPHPTPDLILQSRHRNLNWLVYRGAINTGIFTVEAGKDLVRMRSTANRFAPSWSFKGTSFHLCSLGCGLCQVVAGWLE